MSDENPIESEKKIIDIKKRIASLMIPEIMPESVKESTLDWVEFRHELGKESDRGCALLASSHLEYLIEKALRAKLVGSKKHLDSLFDFNGPLGTFSSRILMSYSIGLLSSEQMNDLQIIRKIRNEFGHSPSIHSFEHPEIDKLCKKLQLLKKLKRGNRSKFGTTVSFLSGTLFTIEFKEVKFTEKLNQNNDQSLEENEKFRDSLKEIFKSEE